MALQMEVHAARRDEPRSLFAAANGERHGRHRHGVRIVRVDDLRTMEAEDARQAPRGREVHLRSHGERHQVVPLAGARVQRARGVCHEHGPVTALAHPEDGQQDLLLAAPPGAGGVDVERDHDSQSLANLSAT